MCFFHDDSDANDMNFIFCARCYGSPRSSLVCTQCHTLTPLWRPDPDLITYYCEECLRNDPSFKTTYLCPICQRLINLHNIF